MLKNKRKQLIRNKKWMLLLTTSTIFLINIYAGTPMKTNNETQNQAWLSHVNELTKLKQTGSFQAKDKSGRPVVLDWLKTDMLSPDYAAALKSVWDVARPAYTKIEVDFLKKYPDVVGTEAYFKPFEKLFKNNIKDVNWTLVEKKTQEILKNFFVFDPSQFPNAMKEKLANIAHIFVSIKDNTTNKTLGFVTFLITPEHAYGDIKCTVFAMLPEEQNKGLGKLLMGSILKILPDIKRIVLCTRITNTTAKQAYLNWGFVSDPNPTIGEHNYTFNTDHWIFLEYCTGKQNILEKVAGMLES